MLLLAIACAGSEKAPPSQSLGWVEEVVADPSHFSVVVNENREGWTALHRNDWFSALSAEGALRSRSAAELERLYAVLAMTSHYTWSILGAARKEHQVLSDSMLLLFFRFSAQAASDAAEAKFWQEKAEAASPRVASAARRWKTVVPPLEPNEIDELSPRMKEHRALRAGTGDLGRFRSLASEPVLVEPVAQSSRSIYDPLVFDSLQLAMQQQNARLDSGLSSALFSGSLFGERGRETLEALGLAYPEKPDGNSCRDLTRALDEKLDAKAATLAASASEDGLALLEDLQLVPGFRSRLLVDLAVEALPASPHCALALGSLALDERGRGIGPLNSPTLFAVLAYADMATGHHREAKDALQKLVPTFPEVLGLDETIGDLVVLESIGIDGEGRE